MPPKAGQKRKAAATPRAEQRAGARARTQTSEPLQVLQVHDHVEPIEFRIVAFRLDPPLPRPLSARHDLELSSQRDLALRLSGVRQRGPFAEDHELLPYAVLSLVSPREAAPLLEIPVGQLAVQHASGQLPSHFLSGEFQSFRFWLTFPKDGVAARLDMTFDRATECAKLATILGSALCEMPERPHSKGRISRSSHSPGVLSSALSQRNNTSFLHRSVGSLEASMQSSSSNLHFDSQQADTAFPQGPQTMNSAPFSPFAARPATPSAFDNANLLFAHSSGSTQHQSPFASSPNHRSYINDIVPPRRLPFGDTSRYGSLQNETQQERPVTAHSNPSSAALPSRSPLAPMDTNTDLQGRLPSQQPRKSLLTRTTSRDSFGGQPAPSSTLTHPITNPRPITSPGPVTRGSSDKLNSPGAAEGPQSTHAVAPSQNAKRRSTFDHLEEHLNRYLRGEFDLSKEVEKVGVFCKKSKVEQDKLLSQLVGEISSCGTSCMTEKAAIATRKERMKWIEQNAEVARLVDKITELGDLESGNCV